MQHFLKKFYTYSYIHTYSYSQLYIRPTNELRLYMYSWSTKVLHNITNITLYVCTYIVSPSVLLESIHGFIFRTVTSTMHAHTWRHNNYAGIFDVRIYRHAS